MWKFTGFNEIWANPPIQWDNFDNDFDQNSISPDNKKLMCKIIEYQRKVMPLNPEIKKALRENLWSTS